VVQEPDILLSLAEWNWTKGQFAKALEYAQDALGIACHSEQRLQQADINNFLARLQLQSGSQITALQHATTAFERAWCDGPPNCYKPALDEARNLLNALGAPLPNL
jgi:ATP/maltotriose-dependent transcriptional regulator MalT